jgi:hypothetical protein
MNSLSTLWQSVRPTDSLLSVEGTTWESVMVSCFAIGRSHNQQRLSNSSVPSSRRRDSILIPHHT